MPFKSEKQKKWMYENKPELARDWEAKTHDTTLPVQKSKNPTPNVKAYRKKSIMKYK